MMPSRSTVIALLALFAALAGTATAARLIDGKQIRKGTVTSRQVEDGSLKQRDLARRTISALRKRLGDVRSEDIADGTVSLADLAPSSVDGTRVVDRSITAGDLVADTVTATELGTGSVGEDELGDDAVGNREIKGGAISRNQLRANVIVGNAQGSAQLDFGALPPEECAQLEAAVGDDALAGAVVMVGAPAALPDDVLVGGRSPDGDVLRVQVCNPTGTAVADLPALDFPYVAFKP